MRTPRAEGGSGTSRAGMWVGGCGFGRGWGVGRRRHRARPRQARPSRVAEVQETRDFTSEQFRRGDTRRVGARSTRAALGAGRPSGPGAGPGRDKRGPPVWPRCRRRGISRRNSSAGAIRGAAAREVPAPPSARGVQAGPGTGPGRDKRGPPVWSRVQGTRDFTSKQFRSEIPHHQTHGGSVAVLRSAQKDREKVGGGAMVGADVPGGPTPARNAVGRLTAWARAGARDARPYQCRGIPLCATPGPLCVTSGPLCTRANQCGRSVRTSRAEGGADTSHAGGAFMCGSYRNTKPKRLGNASVWC